MGIEENLIANASVIAQQKSDSDYLPRELFRVAESLGAVVFESVDMPDEKSGYVKRDKDNGSAVIVLNNNHTKVRKRFTLAHEIGHLVYRENIPALKDKAFIAHRDENSTTGQDPEERFANKFAAELLMPEEEIKTLRNLDASFETMRRRFFVSNEALKTRLQSLGIVDVK